MNEKRRDDQLELIYNSSGPIEDVALNTYRERWTIEKSGRSGSGRSALVARHDVAADDDGLFIAKALFISRGFILIIIIFSILYCIS